MKATFRAGLSNLEEDCPPRGNFEFVTEPSGQKRFWFVCPGRCGATTFISLRPVIDAKTVHSWEWDGNADEPTLNPSINHVGCWHGWLKKGVFAE